MAIWIEEDAKLLVQGITGKQGMFHADKMVEYGTNVVGGCTPGKGGQTVELQGKPFPVWNSMFEAIEATDADATVIYVPPPFAAEAIMEAADAFATLKGGKLLFCRSFATGNDGASMTHPLAGWGSGTCNETDDGLRDVFSSPSGGFLFGVPTDFTDHDDGFGLVVGLERGEALNEAGPVDGVAADTAAGRLTLVDAHRLGDRFVGEGAGL